TPPASAPVDAPEHAAVGTGNDDAVRINRDTVDVKLAEASVDRNPASARVCAAQDAVPEGPHVHDVRHVWVNGERLNPPAIEPTGPALTARRCRRAIWSEHT